MTDVNLFKKSFWLGRLIWVNGHRSVDKTAKLGSLLLECRIVPSEVLNLNPAQFIDMVTRGVSRDLIERYEVVVINGFEDLHGQHAVRFLEAIQSFSELQVGYSLQLILISSQAISADLERFERFKPTEIVVEPETEDPGEMNERVHGLLSIAMKIAGVRVTRISERAAVFLETFLLEEGDYDALVLLARGIGRSNRRVLRLSDLVPVEPERLPAEGDLAST